jgi:pimeloyl-ACP methyl ester carboxylesterase
VAEGHAVFAPDYSGFGRSEGRLESEEATTPALANLVLCMAGALGIEGAADELVEQRRQATARELSEAEQEDYLSPWYTEDGARSWTAMARAADACYAEELVEPLKEMGLPTLLLWGDEDEFQPIDYARRFDSEIPRTRLVAVPGARHIPMEGDPEQVGIALCDFFADT